MNAPIPRTMRDVLQRMVQLQYTSRLTLDENSSTRSTGSLICWRRSMRAFRTTSEDRGPTYREMRARRKISHFNVVTSFLPELSSARTSHARLSTRIKPDTTTRSSRDRSRKRAGLRAGVARAGSGPAASGKVR